MKFIVIFYETHHSQDHFNLRHWPPFKCSVTAGGPVATALDSTAPDELVPRLLHRNNVVVNFGCQPQLAQTFGETLFWVCLITEAFCISVLMLLEQVITNSVFKQ